MLQTGAVIEVPSPQTGDLDRNQLSDRARRRKRNALRRCAIEYSVSRVFAVPVSALHSATRGPAPVALARQTAMYLAHVICGLSLTEVGRTFERDRTTVSHACALIEDRRDDQLFDQLLELLERVAREEVRRRLGGEEGIVAPRCFTGDS
jgi:chromosomal replication initiation ATPase DnaA